MQAAINLGGGFWLYESDPIDAKTVAATTIFTTSAAGRFFPTHVVVELTDPVAITVSPVITIGTNSATYDNILASSSPGISAHAAVGDKPVASGTSIAAGTDVKVNVSTGATGTSANVTVRVLGFYR